MTGACQSILIGHEGEISKVAFNPQGVRILTASSDKTARLWDVETGDCLQVVIIYIIRKSSFHCTFLDSGGAH